MSVTTPIKKSFSNPPDYSLLMQRLEKILIRNPESEQACQLLKQENVWKRLPPEHALHWAKLAQIAGLHEVSLEVLAWTNEKAPDFHPAWQERIELLKSLGHDRQASALQSQQPGVEEPTSPSLSPAKDEKAMTAVSGATDEEKGIEAPFLSWRRQEEMLARYLALFRGREDCFARQWADKQAGTQGYVPVRRPMEAADVLDHIRGHRTYGIYLLQQDSRVRLAVVDADLVTRLRSGTLKGLDRDQLRREKSYLLQRLSEIGHDRGMPFLAEFSGGKGFHFWYFFEEPVPAALARQALQDITRLIGPDLSCFNLEVFPKQDQLAGKGLGNLVKLPLGVHRATGKVSFFLHVQDRSSTAQLEALNKVRQIPSRALSAVGSSSQQAEVVLHPRYQDWAEEYPELAHLSQRCTALGQIFAICRESRSLSVREEKILLGTVGFLPRAKTLLHHLLQQLPEYNPHLVDYKLSRLRGAPLGCRRIHSLLNLTQDVCPFTQPAAYPHPLLHLPEWSQEKGVNKAERVDNLQDALENLKQAIGVVQRFLPSHTPAQ